MVNPTLSPRALRRIWSQLPPPARWRLNAQLVFLLRPTDVGAMNEPIRYSVSPPQPPPRRTYTSVTMTQSPQHGSTPKPPDQRPTSPNATTSRDRPHGSTRSCAVERRTDHPVGWPDRVT